MLDSTLRLHTGVASHHWVGILSTVSILSFVLAQAETWELLKYLNTTTSNMRSSRSMTDLGSMVRKHRFSRPHTVNRLPPAYCRPHTVNSTAARILF